MTFRTCNNCGWVHFGVTRAYVEDEVRRFNEYVQTIDPEKCKEWHSGRPASIRDYEYCHCGNSHENFRPTKPGDCPDGCTIGPILMEE